MPAYFLNFSDVTPLEEMVAQKRLITRSLSHDQGQSVDCHDSSSNKADSGDDQNMAADCIRASSLSFNLNQVNMTAHAWESLSGGFFHFRLYSAENLITTTPIDIDVRIITVR